MNTGWPGSDSAEPLGTDEDVARPAGTSRSGTRPRMACPAAAARWKERDARDTCPGRNW